MPAAPADLHGVSSLSPSSPFPGAGGPFAARLKWLRDGGRAALIRHGLARRGEREPARRRGRHACRGAPHPARARRGADSSVHHDRLFRSVAGARDAAAADPMGDAAVPLRPARVHRAAPRRRAAVAGQHAVRAAGRRRDSDRGLRPVEPRPHEDRVSPRSRPPLRPRDAGHRGRAFQLLVAAGVLARVPSVRAALRAACASSARPSSWGSCATIAAARGS